MGGHNCTSRRLPLCRRYGDSLRNHKVTELERQLQPLWLPSRQPARRRRIRCCREAGCTRRSTADRVSRCCRESVKTPGRGTASGGVGTVTDGIHECAGRSKLHVDARVRQSTSMPAPSGTIVISVSAVVTTALNPCTGPSTGASRRRSLSFCHAETHYRSSSGTLTPCKTSAT